MTSTATRKRVTTTDKPKAYPEAPKTLAEAARRMRAEFKKAILHTTNEFDATAVAREITAELNKNKREVIAKLLGFDNSWGRWEVRHSQNSPIANMLAQECEAELRAWAREAVQDFLETERDKTKSQFKKVLRERVSAAMRDNYRITTDAANEVANNLKAELIAEIKDELKETENEE